MPARTVLITGATGDIGSAIARRTVRAGWIPVVASRSADSARALAASIGGGAVGVEIDILDRASCERAVNTARSVGRLHGLVCSAGQFSFADALTMGAGALREALEVNVVGSFVPAQAVARALIDAGLPGSVVLVSSSAGQRSVGAAAYSASKGAVEALGRELALAFAPHAIRVNTISPGIVESEMSREALDTPDIRRAFLAHTPLGRAGHVDEIAAAVEFLLREESSFVTGTVLAADGGYLSR